MLNLSALCVFSPVVGKSQAGRVGQSFCDRHSALAESCADGVTTPIFLPMLESFGHTSGR